MVTAAGILGVSLLLSSIVALEWNAVKVHLSTGAQWLGFGLALGCAASALRQLYHALLLQGKVQRLQLQAQGLDILRLQLETQRVHQSTPTPTPVGSLFSFAGDAAPEGYLLCDGSLLSLENHPEYLALARVLGGKFDVTGGTAPYLPDLRGRTVMGAGPGPSLTPRKAGARGGSEEVTLTVGQLPSHGHACAGAGAHRHELRLEYGTNKNLSDGPGAQYSQITSNQDYGYTGSGNNVSEKGTHTHDVQNTGGNLSHDNMPPFLVLNYMVKY